MKALVVGGGVGGPAVALVPPTDWAGTSRSSRRRAEPDPHAGAFLNVATNGLAVLTELGVTDRLRTDAHPCPQMVMWSGRGKRLGEVPNGPAGQPERGSVIVRRGWLQQVLREAALEANVPITFGARLASLEEQPGRHVATTTDGRLFGADIVIGADGIGSVARRFVDPAASAPTYSGLVGLGGFAHGTGLEPTPGHQHFVFGRRSFFGYLVRDDGTVYWFANSTRPEPSREDLRAMPAEAWLDELTELHRDDAPPVPQILAAADDTVGAYPIYDLMQVEHWHRGRAVLLGDAVHATSPSAGQGAALTLEDAETLARCLRDIDDSGRGLRAVRGSPAHPYRRDRPQRANRASCSEILIVDDEIKDAARARIAVLGAREAKVVDLISYEVDIAAELEVVIAVGQRHGVGKLMTSLVRKRGAFKKLWNTKRQAVLNERLR